jgi:hypothetical protein
MVSKQPLQTLHDINLWSWKVSSLCNQLIIASIVWVTIGAFQTLIASLKAKEFYSSTCPKERLYGGTDRAKMLFPSKGHYPNHVLYHFLMSSCYNGNSQNNWLFSAYSIYKLSFWVRIWKWWVQNQKSAAQHKIYPEFIHIRNLDIFVLSTPSQDLLLENQKGTN